MLPRHARMRRSEDFRRTVRHGVRAGRRTVVVHAWRRGPVVDQHGQRVESDSAAPVVGFVVARAVGPAVLRNRVRRRLRHLSAGHVSELDPGTTVVVRALPPAARAGSELSDDLGAAWTAALVKLQAATGRAAQR